MQPSPENGVIALVANPASKSGKGAAAIAQAADLLRARVGDDRLQVLTTDHALHAVEIARTLGDEVGCVVALGGDGLINEVANGLMGRPRDDRPALAVIPMGSGNDYAESLGMAYTIPTAVNQILAFNTIHADVGRVNDRYFVETLSFGLDAAIALDTVERRQRKGHAGTRLYLESAVDQLFNHLVTYHFRANVVEGAPGVSPRTFNDEAYLVALQLGPTYGGHFRITPHASLTDGLLDMCWATPHLSSLRALAVLLRARAGKHTGSSHIHFTEVRMLELDFEEEPPGQIDGEKIEGTHFVIECLPNELTVVVGKPEAAR